MAKFNPDVQEPNAPTYLGLSQAPEGNKSTAALIKGFGDTLGGAITGADATVKQVIENRLFNAVDTTREAETGALEQMAGIPPGLRVGDIQPSGELAGSRLMPGQLTVPPGVEAGAEDIGRYGSASKISPELKTYYSGRLDLIAKDLRSQFPGYRDFIDKKFEQVTGMNPANQVIHDLMTMISSQQSANASEMQKAITYANARSGIMGGPNGDRHSYEVISLLQRGQTGGYSPMEFVTRWFARTDELTAKNEQITKQASANAAVRTDTGAVANQSLTQMGVNYQAKLWNDIKDTAFGQNFKGFDDLIQKASNDPNFGTDPQLQQMAYILKQRITTAANELKTKAQASPMGPGLPSMYVAAGKEADASINQGFSQINAVLDRIISKDGTGLLGRQARSIDDTINSSNSTLLQDPAFRGRVLGLAAANKFGGNAVAAMYASKEIETGLDKDLHSYFDIVKDRIADPTLPGFNLKTAVQEAAGKGIGDISIKQGDPKFRPNAMKERSYFDSLTGFPQAVLNNPKVKDDLKLQIANKTFSPDTYGIIHEFAAGPNQAAVFSKLTDKDGVVSQVKRLSTADPTLWDSYGKWVDHEFRNEIFANQITALSKYPETTNMQIVYDPKTYTFSAANTLQGANPLRKEWQGHVDRVNNDLRVLNTGIRGVANYIEANGGDPNAYVLRTMMNAGMDPKKTIGIPGEMMQSMILSAQPAKDPFGTKNPNKSQDRAP